LPPQYLRSAAPTPGFHQLTEECSSINSQRRKYV
jgi:hypothetical protein